MSGSRKRLAQCPDTPWRRWCPFGKVAHANGAAPALLEGGWLPRIAAAEAFGLSLGAFDRAVREGVIRSRSIGPGARLYEVPA